MEVKEERREGGGREGGGRGERGREGDPKLQEHEQLTHSPLL